MKRKANREDENLNEDDNFEEEKILKKHRMTNHRSRSPDLSQPSYMREFKMNFNKDDRDEETKETKEIKETKEQKEPKRSKDNSGAKTSRLVDFGEQPLTEGIEDVDDHFIKVQENMLGEVDDDEFSEDYEEELMIK